MSRQPRRRLTSSTPELRAQFQPHRETKKEVTTPGKHVLLPVHMKMAAGSLLSFTGKGGVVAAESYQ